LWPLNPQMIDFAHVFEIQDGGIDEGYNKGVDNLISLFQRIREGKKEYFDPSPPMSNKVKQHDSLDDGERRGSHGKGGIFFPSSSAFFS
jgi:hypothetical protein